MKKLVLLVDDEDIIRLTSGEILEELGFNVITAATGTEGIELFKAKKDEISIVIIDMTLPDMTGSELLKLMIADNANAKFLLTSGYSRDMTDAGSDAAFIQKPYSITELINKLTELMG